MLTATLILEIVGLALTAGTAVASSVINNMGSEIRSKILRMASQLSAQISRNNILMDKITNAYQNKNNQLLTEMMNGLGYGPRIQNLVNQFKKNETQYQEEITKIKQANVQLEQEVNNLNAASSNAGAGIRGNALAGEQIEQTEKKFENELNQQQNVNGGLVERKE
jgi:hypothetical protein